MSQKKHLRKLSRKQLLKLTQKQLIKECKKNKIPIPITGSKKDMVDRLLIKYKKQSKNDHNTEITKKKNKTISKKRNKKNVHYKQSQTLQLQMSQTNLINSITSSRTIIKPPRFGATKYYMSMRKLIGMDLMCMGEKTDEIKNCVNDKDEKKSEITYNCKVDKWIDRNPELIKVIRPHLSSQPFANISVMFIHHITDTLGTISSIRQLGCTDLTVLFIGYNSCAEKAYFPELSDLPPHEFKAFTIKTNDETHQFELSNSGSQYSDHINFPFDQFNALFKQNNFGFLECIRSLSSFLLLNYSKQNFLIIEDGGYISPILNEAGLTKISINDYCKKYNIPPPKDNDTIQPDSMSMDMFLDKYMIGSVEHTRNGYDRLKCVELKYKKLYKPNFSIACSYVKTQIESESVAASVLNGATNVLYSLGKVFLTRNVLVMGCRGNIGRYIMEQLEHRIKDPETQRIGCDIKINKKFSSTHFPDGDGLKPQWLISAQEPSTTTSKEIEKYDDLSLKEKLNFDTIIGTTGGSSKKYKTFDENDLILWLCQSKKKELFFISASTKKLEFKEILCWLNNEVKIGDKLNNKVLNREDNKYYFMNIISSAIIDDNSHLEYGTNYMFTINGKITKNVYFFNNGMPINFLFYGVPNEYLDMIMTQLVDISILLTNKYKELSEPSRIYLVDYDLECTKGVYKAFYQNIKPIEQPIKIF